MKVAWSGQCLYQIIIMVEVHQICLRDVWLTGAAAPQILSIASIDSWIAFLVKGINVCLQESPLVDLPCTNDWVLMLLGIPYLPTLFCCHLLNVLTMPPMSMLCGCWLWHHVTVRTSLPARDTWFLWAWDLTMTSADMKVTTDASLVMRSSWKS